jgi:hypothetical protein
VPRPKWLHRCHGREPSAWPHPGGCRCKSGPRWSQVPDPRGPRPKLGLTDARVKPTGPSTSQASKAQPQSTAEIGVREYSSKAHPVGLWPPPTVAVATLTGIASQVSQPRSVQQRPTPVRRPRSTNPVHTGRTCRPSLALRRPRCRDSTPGQRERVRQLSGEAGSPPPNRDRMTTTRPGRAVAHDGSPSMWRGQARE